MMRTEVFGKREDSFATRCLLLLPSLTMWKNRVVMGGLRDILGDLAQASGCWSFLSFLKGFSTPKPKFHY